MEINKQHLGYFITISKKLLDLYTYNIISTHTVIKLLKLINRESPWNEIYFISYDKLANNLSNIKFTPILLTKYFCKVISIEFFGIYFNYKTMKLVVKAANSSKILQKFKLTYGKKDELNFMTKPLSYIINAINKPDVVVLNKSNHGANKYLNFLTSSQQEYIFSSFFLLFDNTSDKFWILDLTQTSFFHRVIASKTLKVKSCKKVSKLNPSIRKLHYKW